MFTDEVMCSQQFVNKFLFVFWTTSEDGEGGGKQREGKGPGNRCFKCRAVLYDVQGLEM